MLHLEDEHCFYVLGPVGRVYGQHQDLSFFGDGEEDSTIDWPQIGKVRRQEPEKSIDYVVKGFMGIEGEMGSRRPDKSFRERKDRLKRMRERNAEARPPKRKKRR